MYGALYTLDISEITSRKNFKYFAAEVGNHAQYRLILPQVQNLTIFTLKTLLAFLLQEDNFLYVLN
jgi:hypothetical protein